MPEPRPEPPLRHRLKDTLRLSPSGFLLDRSNGESYTLNPSAMLIVRALLDGRSSVELWRELVATFEVDEARARRDVEQLVVRLRQLGLVKAIAELEAKTAAQRPAEKRADQPQPALLSPLGDPAPDREPAEPGNG